MARARHAGLVQRVGIAADDPGDRRAAGREAARSSASATRATCW